MRPPAWRERFALRGLLRLMDFCLLPPDRTQQASRHTRYLLIVAITVRLDELD